LAIPVAIPNPNPNPIPIPIPNLQHSLCDIVMSAVLGLFCKWTLNM